MDSTLLSQTFEILTVTIGMVIFVNLLALTLIYTERKVAAHFQCRVGPMRVGFHGILQPIADAVKLLMKESPVPAGADKLLFNLAPVIPFAATFGMLAIIPFPIESALANLNAGVIFLSAVSSVGVIGLLVAGWSSNNKYSLLGGMRTGAQIISYEVSASLALLTVVIFSGSLNLGEIVASQADGWWIWRGHLPVIIAFVIFTIASTAECNRTPFDLVEGESELTAGFHTEYAGMKFAMFFLAEFINVFVVSAISATLFFGGWLPLHIPGADSFNAVMTQVSPKVWFLGKTGLLIFLIMWFRWTFPRLRIDQLMKLEWKLLLPVGLLNLFLAAIISVYNLYPFSN